MLKEDSEVVITMPWRFVSCVVSWHRTKGTKDHNIPGTKKWGHLAVPVNATLLRYSPRMVIVEEKLLGLPALQGFSRYVEHFPRRSRD